MRWAAPLRVPALWLAPVLGLFFAQSFWILPGGPFHAFAPSDSDDYMRLVEVRSFLQGQGWYDLSVSRLGWGELTVIPWSRLVDLPLAGVAQLLSFFTNPAHALELAAAILPLLLLVVGLLPLSLALVRPLVPRTQAWLAPWIVIGCVTPLLYQFNPGRVDHHAYQVLFAGWGLAMLLRQLVRPAWCAPGFGAALGFSLAHWVGGEGFVGLFLFCAALAFWAAWFGGAWLAAAARFGAAFAVFSALVLPLARPLAAWGDLAVSWYSSAYLLFALCVGAVFVLAWALGRSTNCRLLRFGLFAAAGFFFASLFFFIVPDALGGPYFNFEGLSGRFILDSVVEAQSYWEILTQNAQGSWDYVRGLMAFALFLWVPTLAAILCCVGLRNASPRRQRLILTSLFFLLAVLVASFFWQRRVLTFVQLFMVPLATLALRRWLAHIRTTESGRTRFWKSCGAFLMLTLLPLGVLLPVLEQKPLYPDSAFVYHRKERHGCNIRPIVPALNDPAGLGATPLRIANLMDDGTELLYRTPHVVMSAPYNVKTNGAAIKFFSARDKETARRIALENQLDLVIVCRDISPSYLREDSGVQPSANFSQKEKALAEALLHKTPPRWLERLPEAGTKDIFVYRVNKTELAR